MRTRIERRIRVDLTALAPARLRDHGGWGRPTGRPREALRRLRGGERDQPRDALGRVLLVARSLRLREDHDAAHDRRLRAARPRGRSCSTARTWRRRRPTSGTSTPCSRTTRCSRISRSQQNVAFGLKYQKVAKGEDKRAGRRCARAGADVLVRRPASEPALGRPAAARRARAGVDPEPEGAPARRAARRSRREAPQASPDRAEGPAGAGRDHVHLRDARPGGGADDVRPHRGDVAGQGRAGRAAQGDLRGARHGLRRRLPGRVEPDGRARRPASRPVGAACTWASSSWSPARATPTRAATARSRSAPSASTSTGRG